jgi:type IV pilus assembly protein PilM
MAASRVLVGLDIGSSGVRAVQLRRLKDRSFEITHAAEADLPRGAVRNGGIHDSKAVVKALRRLWKQGRFSTKRVAFGLADAGVFTRQLDLPWMPPDDFRSALRYQIGDSLPVDVSSVELDYHLLDRTEGTDDRGQPTPINRVLIVAADQQAVASEAQVLRKAGLEPVVADSTALALIRVACQGRLPQDGVTRAVADIGADQLTVVIHQDGQPRFIRTIANLGGDAATEAVAARLDVELEAAESIKRVTGLNGPAPILAPVAESSVFSDTLVAEDVAADPRTAATIEVLSPWATSLVAEIRNSLDYYQAAPTSGPVESLTLVGRTVALGGMVERVATQLPVPVHALDPTAGLATSKRVAKQHPDDPRLAAAIGLAMAVAP